MAAWEHGLRNEEGFTTLLYRIYTQEEAKTRDHVKETESEREPNGLPGPNDWRLKGRSPRPFREWTEGPEMWTKVNK
eukprot:14995469-Heterocapsa_arctica.AAC.1